MKNACKILVGLHEDTRDLGTARHRHKDNPIHINSYEVRGCGQESSGSEWDPEMFSCEGGRHYRKAGFYARRKKFGEK
jgi:hypothetical protein